MGFGLLTECQGLGAIRIDLGADLLAERARLGAR